ncbi:MAG: hypothetical protein QXM75_02625 [Candidatus Diapherotrites archaeon]
MQNLEKEIEELLLSFGIKLEFLERWQIERIGNSYWITSKGLKSVNGFNVQCKGLRIAEKTKLGLKPTSYGLQFLAPYIKNRVVELSKEELLSIVKAQPIRKNCDDGYIAVSFGGHIIGCALAKQRMIYSQFPKVLAIAISEANFL